MAVYPARKTADEIAFPRKAREKREKPFQRPYATSMYELTSVYCFVAISEDIGTRGIK